MDNEETARTPANYSLPFEILSKIFMESLLPWYEPYTKETVPYRRMESATIRRAAQVCQYWRGVALEVPILWGTIINVDFDTTAWIKELIRRSGNGPMVVQSDSSFFYRSDDWFQSEKWALLFNEMHRIRILHLTIPWSPYTDYRLLKDALSKPAPFLESVSIYRENRFGVQDDDGPQLDLQPYLFNGHTPSLREVVTSGTGLLPTLLLSHMKLVNLKVFLSKGDAFYTPLAWLAVLKGQPQLQYLSLSIHQRPSPRFPPMAPDYPSVSLPDLEYLYLDGRQDFCDQLFPKLVVPTSCILDLSSDQSRNMFSTVDGIVQGITAYFNGWQEEENCRAWTIVVVNNTDILLLAYKYEDADIEMPIASISFRLQEDQGDFVVVAIFRALQDFNLLKGAESLKFRFYTPLSPPVRITLASLLESCEQTQEVILMGPNTAEVLLNTILMDDAAQLADSGPSRDAGDHLSTTPKILLPNLTTLVLNIPENEQRDISDTMFKFLRWRRDVGRSIPHLSVCVRQPETVQFMHGAHPDLNLHLDINNYEHWVLGCRYTPPSCVV